MSNESRNYSIDQLLITPSNGRNSKPISLGSDGTAITDFKYHESILSETIKCTVTYSDIGQYSPSGEVTKTVLEGMPLEGGEDVNIIFKDLNHDVTLKFDMQVRTIKQVYKDTTKSIVTLDLVSAESIKNYKSVVKKRYDQKISDSVESILKDSNILNTKKKLDIEKTLNNYNFIGNNNRPFYVIHWLANFSIPDLPGAEGNTAGFFFFETSDGFKFKSIDGMLSENEPGGGAKNIKTFVYNQTVNIPSGDYSKILELNPPNPSGDVIKKLEAGTYSTRTILFDPFNGYYEVINPNSQARSTQKGSEENLVKGGKNLPKINPKFNVEGTNKDFSKTKYYLLDTGTLPTGNTSEQIKKSEKQNFDPKNVLNQYSMRYNQFFSSSTEITVFGDFSLHAGDLIYIKTPELSNKRTQEMDEQLGGYYVIADLCHYYNVTHGCFTKITAVRDSTGRKGNPVYKPF